MHRNAGPAAVLLLLLLAGCGGPEPEVVAPAPAPVARPERFAPPEGWQRAAAGANEVVRFRIPRADGDEVDAHVVVKHYPGGRGARTLLDDWRGRFAEIDHGHDRMEERGSGLRLDIAGRYRGPDPEGGAGVVDRPRHRLVAAVLVRPEGLYRVTVLGPKGTLGKWEDTVEVFLASIPD